MKPSEKIKGIAFACNTTGGYDMVRQSGVEWMRLNICFPWTDKISGTLSAQFVSEREEFRRGLKLFAEHPKCIGSFMFYWRKALHCCHCGADDCPAEDYWGLVTTGLMSKPAFYAAKKTLAEYYK